jgi:hypothetical protein
MSAQTRAEAEARLREVATVYDQAVAAVTAAKKDAEDAVFQAKQAGLSQHDIARIMGPVWGAEHNPQFPPVLDLQRQPAPPAAD